MLRHFTPLSKIGLSFVRIAFRFPENKFCNIVVSKKTSAKIQTLTPDYKAKLVTTRVVNGKYYTEYLQWLTGDGHAGMLLHIN